MGAHIQSRDRCCVFMFTFVALTFALTDVFQKIYPNGWTGGVDLTSEVVMGSVGCASPTSDALLVLDLHQFWRINFVRISTDRNATIDVILSNTLDPSAANLCGSVTFQNSTSTTFQSDVWCGDISARYVTITLREQSQSIRICDLQIYGHQQLPDAGVTVDGEVRPSGLWPDNGWTDLDLEDEDASMQLSFFKREEGWVWLQGSVASGISGRDHPILRLPVEYRPEYELEFVCSSAASEPFPDSASPVLISVAPSGFVAVTTPHSVPSVSMDGIQFPLPQTERKFSTLTSRLSHTFEEVDADRYGHIRTFYDSMGIVHIFGFLRAVADCTASQCVIAQLNTTELPEHWENVQLQAAFPQPENSWFGSTGDVPQLTVFVNASGHILSTKIQKDQFVRLDGLELLPATNSRTFSNVMNLEATYPWMTAAVPPRATLSPHNEVKLGGVVYFERGENSFDGFQITQLPDTLRPDYITRQPVACQIGGLAQQCTVTVSTDGIVTANTDIRTSATDNWLSLDGVSFGGYVYRTEVSLSGSGTILIDHQAVITLG